MTSGARIEGVAGSMSIIEVDGRGINCLPPGSARTFRLAAIRSAADAHRVRDQCAVQCQPIDGARSDPQIACRRLGITACGSRHEQSNRWPPSPPIRSSAAQFQELVENGKLDRSTFRNLSICEVRHCNLFAAMQSSSNFRSNCFKRSACARTKLTRPEQGADHSRRKRLLGQRGATLLPRARAALLYGE